MGTDLAATRDSATSEAIIVAAAIEAFAATGYHGTSIRNVAERAGTSVSTMYTYFSSKYELLLSILDRVMDDLIAETAEAIASVAEPNGAERLKAAIRAYISFHARRSAECFIAMSEIRSLDPKERKRYVAKRDREQGMFRQIIDDGIDRGEFMTSWPGEISRALVTMCSAVATWYRPGGPLTPRELADIYLDLALGMIGAQSALQPRRL